MRAEWNLLPEKRPILTFNDNSFASVLPFYSELSQDWQAPRKSGPTCNCGNRFAISCSAVKLFYLGTIWLAAQRQRMGISTHWLGYFTLGDIWAIHALRTSASWHKHTQSYLRDWVHLQKMRQSLQRNKLAMILGGLLHSSFFFWQKYFKNCQF